MRPWQAATVKDHADLIGPFEILETLGRGGMGVVYRARHLETGQLAAVKTARLFSESLLQSIRREIHALAAIRHPGIVKILSEGVHQGLPWYSMELLDATTLREWRAGLERRKIRVGSTPSSGQPSGAGEAVPSSTPWWTETLHAPTTDRPSPIAGRPWAPATAENLGLILTLLRRLCSPLAFIHGEGIVHGDLKPENVLIRSDGRPVLVDFGLVSQFTGEVSREALWATGLASAGTPGYMAPEQTLGEVVDARTDLYALGCMMYELLTGRLPFEATNVMDLLAQQLQGAPARVSDLVPSLPAEVGDLALRLLAQHPRERMGHADDVAAVLGKLGAANGLAASGPRPRPYLYRSGLAGRDAALDQLRGHLARLKQGTGSAVFIGGEAGVGKTRLVLEFIREATRHGVRVLAGECLDVGGQALEGLRRPLEILADRCREAGRETSNRLVGPRGKVLGAYQPELAKLPGQEAYAEPAELSAEAARLRLFSYLFEVFRALAEDQPVVIVLDDVQWGDDLTLGWLEFLLRGYDLATVPILVVGTYRSEELTLGLRKLLESPAAGKLEIDRLDDTALSSMVGDMLALAEPPAEFVHSLANHTEGNPFFVAEYLRAAVEGGVLSRDETGKWRLGAADVKAVFQALPVPGLLQDLISHRLDGLDGEARALVEVAAVLGREADLTLLARVLGTDPAAMRAQLLDLLRRRVLEERSPGQLRFVHDKTREVAYARMDPQARAKQHRAAAEQYERAYADDLSPFHAVLAHHWAGAGDALKTIEHLDKAGSQALRGGAYREAAGFFREAIKLDQESRGHWRQLAAPGRFRRATWHRQLAEAYQNLGDYSEGRVHLPHGLRLLGWRPAGSRFVVLAGLFPQVVLQAFHRLLPERALTGRAAKRPALLEGTRCFQRLVETYWFANDTLRLVDAGLRSLNLAERAGRSPELARAYAIMCLSAGSIPIHRLAERYARCSLEVARGLGQPAVLSYSLFITNVYRVGAAQWSRVEAELEECARLCEEIGDRRFLGESWTVLGMSALYQGDFRRASQRFSDVLVNGQQTGNFQHKVWGMIGKAEAVLRLGSVDEAARLLEDVLKLLDERPDPTEELRARGLLAVLCWCRGEQERAEQLAQRASELTGQLFAPTSHYLLEGYAGVAEVRLRRWQASKAHRNGGARSLRRAGLSACRALQHFSRVFPIGRPRAALFHGWACWLSGDASRAKKLWSSGLQASEELGMPYERGFAHSVMGELLPASDPEREEHIALARKAFASLRIPQG